MCLIMTMMIFLDTISKGGSTSDTTVDKNGPTGPPDDAPVDMVSVHILVYCLLVCVYSTHTRMYVHMYKSTPSVNIHVLYAGLS